MCFNIHAGVPTYMDCTNVHGLHQRTCGWINRLTYLHCVVLAVAATVVATLSCDDGLIDAGGSYCYALSSEKSWSSKQVCESNWGAIIPSDESDSLYVTIISQTTEASGEEKFWVSQESASHGTCVYFNRITQKVESASSVGCFINTYCICEYIPGFTPPSGTALCPDLFVERDSLCYTVVVSQQLYSSSLDEICDASLQYATAADYGNTDILAQVVDDIGLNDNKYYVNSDGTGSSCRVFTRDPASTSTESCESGAYRVLCQFDPYYIPPTSANDFCPTDYFYDDTYGTYLCYKISSSESSALFGGYSCDLVSSQDTELLHRLVEFLGQSGDVVFIDKTGLSFGQVREYRDSSQSIFEGSYSSSHGALCYTIPLVTESPFQNGVQRANGVQTTESIEISTVESIEITTVESTEITTVESTEKTTVEPTEITTVEPTEITTVEIAETTTFESTTVGKFFLITMGILFNCIHQYIYNLNTKTCV
ncbi:uncharacterized protein [Apostichopus japonicus]|uniref:uncharacterized protein isoform X3 n=1 Tax=Stichopus japonicus TaxID=307972 RepID=UPI003AB1CAA7